MISFSGDVWGENSIFLAQLATSDACERVFYRARRMHDDFKNGTSESTLNHALMVHEPLKVRHHMNVFVFIMCKEGVYCIIIIVDLFLFACRVVWMSRTHEGGVTLERNFIEESWALRGCCYSHWRSQRL
jgi:hypothetical protein